MRPPPRDLVGFPTAALEAGTPLHRVHRRRYDPFHFSASKLQRFDTRAGTCYLAESVIGALLETARGLTLLPPDWRDDRAVVTVRLPADVRLADTTSPAAYQYGVTGDLASGDDYDTPQQWAERFLDDGFDGIRYAVRHDTAGAARGVALFGTDGARAALASARTETFPVSPCILADTARYGIRVVDVLTDEEDEAEDDSDTTGSATA